MAIKFLNSVGVDTDVLFVDTASERVGIGTVSPGFKLDVSGDGIRNIRTTAGWAGWFENTGSSSGVIVTAGVDSGDAPLLIRKQDGTELFSVRGNGVSWFNGGNVGIGTTSPSAKLQISTTMTSSPTSNIFLDVDGANTTGGGGSIIFGTSATAGSTTSYNAKITGIRVAGGIGGDSQLGFWTTLASDSVNPQERMTITKEGNVGIGTTSPSEKLHVDGNLRVTGAYYDSNNAPGTLDQVLTSTATGVAWVDPSTITAEAATLVVIECKNTSGATITKGTPVYQTGTVGATDVIEIAAADALISSGKQPAIGLLQTTLNNNGFGKVVITGELTNFTTDPIDGVTPTTGDKVFVKSGGGLTLTKPTGEGNGIQNMGLVGKVSGGNAGSITVSSIMRTNDVPNLPEGRIWVGDGNTIVSDTVYIDETNLRLGIGTDIPSSRLDIRTNGVNDGLNLSTSQPVSFAKIFNGNSESFPVGNLQLGYGSNITAGIQALSNRMSLKGGYTTGGQISFLSASTEVMRMTSTSLGIGTTSPSAPLTFGKSVYGDFDSENFYRIKLQDQGGILNDVGIGQTATGNLGFNITAGKDFLFNGGTSGNALTLGSSGNATFAGTISAQGTGDSYFTGNVGIGTTAPSTKLDVAGNANISDTLAIGSLSTVPTASLGRALNIQVLANSSGTTVAQWLDVDRTITTNSTSANTYGMLLRNASTTTSTANDGNIYGAQIIGRHQGTGGINSAMGVRGTADINTTGTITTTGSLWGAYNEGQVTNGSVTFTNSGIYGTASIAQVLGSGTVNITTRGIVGVGSVGGINNVNATVNRVVAGEFELDLQNGTTEQAHVISLNTYNITSPTNLSIDEFAYIYLGEDVAIPTTVTDNAYFIKSLTSLPSELAGSIEATSFIKTGGTSSQFLKADGSVDTNTYLTSADVTSSQWDDVTGGISYVSGNVGIGTTSPQTKLHINRTTLGEYFRGGSGGLRELRFSTYNTASDHAGHKIDASSSNGEITLATGGSARVTVDNTGNVGIGTTSPTQDLTLYKSSGDTNFLISSNNGASQIFFGDTESDNIGKIDYDHSDNSLNFAVNAAERMRITSAGNVGIGTTSPAHKLTVNAPNNTTAVGIDFPSAHFDFSANSTSGYTSNFRLDDVGMDIGHDSTARSLNLQTGNLNRVTILGNGNVGIGTTSPVQKLHVNGASDGNSIYTAMLQNTGTAAGTASKLLFVQGGSTVRGAVVGGLQEATAGSPTSMVFETSAAYANPSERMRITSAGDTGIGVTTPRAKLDVAGGIKVADDTDTAGANKVGTLRYRTSGNNSYVDMCMQTGASTYAWINVVQNNW